MKKVLILVFAGAWLAGCATISNPLNQSRVDTLNASWGAALAIANGYRTSCAQRLIASSCRPIVKRLQIAAVPVQAAVVKARAYATDTTLSTTDLISIAESAVSEYKNLQSQLGVN